MGNSSAPLKLLQYNKIERNAAQVYQDMKRQESQDILAFTQWQEPIDWYYNPAFYIGIAYRSEL